MCLSAALGWPVMRAQGGVLHLQNHNYFRELVHVHICHNLVKLGDARCVCVCWLGVVFKGEFKKSCEPTPLSMVIRLIMM